MQRSRCVDFGGPTLKLLGSAGAGKRNPGKARCQQSTGNNLQGSGNNREMVVRKACKDLLGGHARPNDLVFIPGFEIETPAEERGFVVGTGRSSCSAR